MKTETCKNILKYVGTAPVYLTEIAMNPEFRGVHYAKIERAANVLKSAGAVIFDGAQIKIVGNDL